MEQCPLCEAMVVSRALHNFVCPKVEEALGEPISKESKEAVARMEKELMNRLNTAEAERLVSLKTGLQRALKAQVRAKANRKRRERLEERTKNPWDV